MVISYALHEKRSNPVMFEMMKTMSSACYKYNRFAANHAQVHELQQSHCGDNQEGKLFS